MQTAGYLIGTAAELAAGMKNSEDRLNRRDTGLRVNFRRHTASVIFDGHDILVIDSDFNLCRITGQGLINRVVDDLPDQVMQTGRRGCTYVHTRSFSDSFKTFQYLYIVRSIVVVIDTRIRHHIPPLIRSVYSLL